MASPAIGEFMGTMVLITLGDGVVASTLLSKSKGQAGGWFESQQAGICGNGRNLYRNRLR